MVLLSPVIKAEKMAINNKPQMMHTKVPQEIEINPVTHGEILMVRMVDLALREAVIGPILEVEAINPKEANVEVVQVVGASITKTMTIMKMAVSVPMISSRAPETMLVAKPEEAIVAEVQEDVAVEVIVIEVVIAALAEAEEAALMQAEIEEDNISGKRKK